MLTWTGHEPNQSRQASQLEMDRCSTREQAASFHHYKRHQIG